LAFLHIHYLKLCERTLNVRGFPVREEGQVELLGETPNGLSASASVPKIAKRCQSKNVGHCPTFRRIRLIRLYENPNLTGTKAGAALCIADCVVLTQNTGSTPDASKHSQPFPHSLISMIVIGKLRLRCKSEPRYVPMNSIANHAPKDHQRNLGTD